MTAGRLRCVLALFASASGFGSPGDNEARAQWPQWGGPTRDFKAESAGLAGTWPEDGPPRIWRRELGDGYSSIVVDAGVLYTMYRVDQGEFTVALDASTGETIWEFESPSPYTDQMAEFGPGPHASPLIMGDRVYTVGTNADFHCFDKQTGKVLWKHDLLEEFGGEVPGYGYSCSPLAYKNTIILPVTSTREQEQPLTAFDPATGRVLWKNEPYVETTLEQFEYATPILIDVDGQTQLVFFGAERISGFDPDNGDLLWSHPHTHRNGVHASPPIWNGQNLLFCSAAYDSGARAIRLTRENGKTRAEQAWYSRKMRVHHGNVIRLGDYVYGSSGDFGPAFLIAMNLETGKPAWRERGFRKATILHADGKLILLDEDGTLALATATPEELIIHARCQITQRISWTVPTLVDTTLYLRDRMHVLALDLGESRISSAR